MKDDACTVRDIAVPWDQIVDVLGFVRVLECRDDDDCLARLRLLVLCDADPIVWRLRFEVVIIDAPSEDRRCLTGQTYIGRWSARRAAVFMHPPTRASDVPWAPNRADMTLVETAR